MAFKSSTNCMMRCSPLLSIMCTKICHHHKRQIRTMTVDWKSKRIVSFNHFSMTKTSPNTCRLEQIVKIDRAEFLLLIKTLSYILKRASTFIMKPTKLQSELKEKLELQDSKIDVIMKLWVKNTKPILDNLETDDDSGQSNQLEHIGWKLKLQLSSEPQQKEKIPLALVQLHTTNDNVNSRSGEPISLEMNHAEVLDFYNQIDVIQNELDALRSNK